jgi:hypothetical protein
MTSDRNTPTAGFWITVALVAVLAYPLSFGPACWWFTRSSKEVRMPGSGTYRCAPKCYWPIGWLAKHYPASFRPIVNWYATVGIEGVEVPTERAELLWFSASRSLR